MSALLTSEQNALLARRGNQLLDNFEKRLDRLEKAANESSAEKGARLGAESAFGSEEELELANRRHRRELQDPTFAKNYCACQRIAATKIRRFRSMLPQRRLA